MSFFSRSRSKGHYPHHSHGGDHYKRRHGSGGILGKIFENIVGSSRYSHSHSRSHSRSYSGSSHHKGHYSGRHHYHKSSWS